MNLPPPRLWRGSYVPIILRKAFADYSHEEAERLGQIKAEDTVADYS